MNMSEVITRINILAKKAKTEGLTPEEITERDKLRRIYIDSVKANLVGQLENTYILQPDGTKKKVAKKCDNCTEQPVKLLTSSDSTSYAAGYAATEGLIQYLTQRLNVDTAHIDAFIRGFREALDKVNDPAFSAYIAGNNIAEQATKQIMPGMSRELVGTDDSIAAKPFYEGFLAGVKQDTTVFKAEKARERFQEKTTLARETRNRIYKKENEEWLASNKTKPGVVTLPSGLQYKVIKEGNGPKPNSTDEGEVVYEGKTINGKTFYAGRQVAIIEAGGEIPADMNSAGIVFEKMADSPAA